MRSLTSLAVVACLVATPCLAQSGAATPATGGNAAKTVPADSTGSLDKATAGANSFTESQARGRAEAAGLSGIQTLKKDDKGVWRGQAMRDGKSVSVAVDYQGDVTTN